MYPRLRLLLLELEKRLNEGPLDRNEAREWAERVHVFTGKTPSSKRQIWSPDGSGKIQIKLPDHIRATPIEKLTGSRMIRSFIRWNQPLATIGDLCDRPFRSLCLRNFGVKTLRELVQLLRALEAGDYSCLMPCNESPPGPHADLVRPPSGHP